MSLVFEKGTLSSFMLVLLSRDTFDKRKIFEIKLVLWLGAHLLFQ